MTERTKNPLLAASDAAPVGKFAIGTPQAVTQLYEHCAMLNAKPWVIASGKPYIVRQNSERQRHEIVRRGEVADEPVKARQDWADAA